MRVIVGCEESQRIALAFRAMGHEAYSNDKKPCSGGFPQYHIQGDVFDAIDELKPDIGIFNPPCTFTAGSSVQWLSHPDDIKLKFEHRREHPLYPGRRKLMYESIEFVDLLYKSKIKKIALENPVGLLSTLWKKPNQIIQPYFFGDQAQKTTCLWLKNLPPLFHAKEIDLFNHEITHVDKGEFVEFESGKRQPKWYADARNLPPEQRRELRSKTFEGIALAMATQWGGVFD
jgi:hypothetical protein